MNSVFVVVAGVDYEGSSPIRVFAEKHLADDFARACSEYEATRPPYPEDGTDDERFSWSAELGVWIGKHPGGADGQASDYFIVLEVPFGPSTAACAATPADSQKDVGGQA